MLEFTKESRAFRKALILILFILMIWSLLCCATPVKNEAESVVEQKPKLLQGKIIIRWQNVKGYDSYGFNIMRSEVREEPFTKINQDIILASTGSKTLTDYSFVDQPLEIGKIYYYYVESVNYAGQKKQMTPLMKVIVKTPIDEPDSPPESQ